MPFFSTRSASRGSDFVAMSLIPIVGRRSEAFDRWSEKKELYTTRGTNTYQGRQKDASMSSVRIKRFDPSGIKESRIIFLIGKRHTVVGAHEGFAVPHARPDTLAMAPTEDTLNMYREFLPECCIFDHFSQEKLSYTVSLQRELVLRGKSERSSYCWTTACTRRTF